jgi:putative two-component system response regulator
LKDIERRLGSSNFLRMAREIAAAHHERWDGTGYPAGLMGEEIPLAARIVAIADVYDALSTRRIYKEAAPHRECVEVLRSEAGRQFDPQLVEVFLEIGTAFENVARQLGARQESATDRIFNQIDRDLAAAAHAPTGLTPEKLPELSLAEE